MLVWEKRSIYFAIGLSLREISSVRARAHVRALMTRKSCAVGMRNAILRNYLNEHGDLYFLLHNFGAQIIPFKKKLKIYRKEKNI